jgi:hypothetical protein
MRVGHARLAAVLWLAPACIAPSVVDSAGRAVAPAEAEIAWRTARAADLDGFFESVSIEGEAAAALWRVEYVFSAEGAYTGAALVIGGTTPEFQTLTGRWRLDGDVLDLGEGQTTRVLAAGDHLRLESAGGLVILRRVPVR